MQVRYIAQKADQLGKSPIMQYCIPTKKYINIIINSEIKLTKYERHSEEKRQSSSTFSQECDKKRIETIVVFPSEHDFHSGKRENNEEEIGEGK